MGRTLFMIHGMWGGGWHWDKVKPFFESRGYQCLSPDLRYHDVSAASAPPPGIGKVRLQDYVSDLEQDIGRLPQKPIIMGHSMGGLLAQMLASRGQARAAVLVAPAAPSGINSIDLAVLRIFAGPLLRWGFWKKPHRLTYEQAVYAMMEKLPESERRYIHARSVWESGKAATEIGLWWLGFKGAEVDQSRVTCPLLIVSGTDDRITPVTTVRKIASKYHPGGDYMEFGGHAHWILREPGWERVAACIALWLSERGLDA